MTVHKLTSSGLDADTHTCNTKLKTLKSQPADLQKGVLGAAAVATLVWAAGGRQVCGPASWVLLLLSYGASVHVIDLL
jgi:hypothetical protein